MKQLVLAFGAAGLLAACTPLGLYYKQGVSVQTAQDAETVCNVKAARDVPVRNVTHVIPGKQIAPRKQCNSNGLCHMTPGVIIPPEFVTRDANAELRRKAADLCMRQKGYEYLRLPACDPAIAKATPEGQTTRLPRLAPNSCVVRSTGGRWQIVTP